MRRAPLKVVSLLRREVVNFARRRVVSLIRRQVVNLTVFCIFPKLSQCRNNTKRYSRDCLQVILKSIRDVRMIISMTAQNSTWYFLFVAL